MVQFRFIEDLTSDVLFEAYGKDLEELFSNAALALFNVICQVNKVEEKITREVEVNGKNPEDLLFNWLQELISIVDTESLFFSRFEILEIKHDGSYLRARCYGEKATPEKGETVVKAITYYRFGLKKNNGYKAMVSLDI